MLTGFRLQLNWKKAFKPINGRAINTNTLCRQWTPIINPLLLKTNCIQSKRNLLLKISFFSWPLHPPLVSCDIIGIIRRKPVPTHASMIVFGGMQPAAGVGEFGEKKLKDKPLVILYPFNILNVSAKSLFILLSNLVKPKNFNLSSYFQFSIPWTNSAALLWAPSKPPLSA